MTQKESKTIEAKHIFLDIVSYTYHRSVEAQCDLIYILNTIVKETIEGKKLKKNEYIFIPTGDGMCISIINVNSPYDIHIQVALSILEKLYKHNADEKDKMRQFQLRIGINENTDNLVIDINGNENISGSGINIASRIEGLSDNNQIIVGNSVFEKLAQREKYMNSFMSYSSIVKHNLPLVVHQFIDNDLAFLNNQVPSIFVPETKQEFSLSTFQGYYIANCIKHESFVTENIDLGKPRYSLKVLLFQLTEDNIAKLNITKSKPDPTIRVEKSIKEQFDYLQSVNFWLLCDLSEYIQQKLPNIYSTNILEDYLFATKEGRNQLIKDQPNICAEFGIS